MSGPAVGDPWQPGGAVDVTCRPGGGALQIVWSMAGRSALGTGEDHYPRRRSTALRRPTSGRKKRTLSCSMSILREPFPCGAMGSFSQPSQHRCVVGW